MSKFGITRPTATVELVTNFDLLADYQAADAELDRLQRGAQPDRLNQSPALREAAQRVQEIEQAMQDSILLVKLRALKRTRWNELTAKHPAREDHDGDKQWDLNVDTFFDEAIPESIVELKWKKSGEKVDFDVAVDWPALAEDITDSQFADFITGVLRINQGSTAVPFSRVASVVTRD